MSRSSFRPQAESLGGRALPGANPVLSISDAWVVEGDGGQTALFFTVSLSKSSRHQVSVNYATADGTATAGGDYTAFSGRLTFAPGETTKTVAILASGDTDIEPDEWLAVNLSGASHATIGCATGYGRLGNDDGTAADWWWIPQLGPNDGNTEEGPYVR